MGRVKSSCCLNCTKRHVGCHSDCADYLEFMQANLKDKAAKAKSKGVYTYNKKMPQKRKSKDFYTTEKQYQSYMKRKAI